MREGRRGRTLAQQEARAGIALLSPTLIVVLFMVVLPILWTIVIAFQSLRLRNLRTRCSTSSSPWTTSPPVLGSPGFWDALKGHLDLQRRRDGAVHRPGADRRPGRAQAVPGPHPGRASMLLPYVAPVVAVTFVWQIMLNPELGHRERHRADLLGWKEPSRSWSSGPGTLSIFGLDLGVPTALIVVILYQAWRYFPFSFLFILARLQALPGRARRGRPGRRGHPPAAVLAHHPAPAPGRHRPADRCSLHLDLQRVRRHLPAHPGRRRHRGGVGAGVQLPHRPRRHRAAAALSLVLALLLVVLLFLYFRFFVGRVEEAESI
jgi:multiple sugar transport system permease protein